MEKVDEGAGVPSSHLLISQRPPRGMRHSKLRPSSTKEEGVMEVIVSEGWKWAMVDVERRPSGICGVQGSSWAKALRARGLAWVEVKVQMRSLLRQQA